MTTKARLTKNIAALALVTLASSLSLTPARGDVEVFGTTGSLTTPSGAPSVTAYYLLSLLFTTTGLAITGAKNGSLHDVSKAQSLLDEAYAGRGEKLDLLSAATKQPVETVADKIVALDKAGKLDPKNPEAMAKTVANALNTP